MIAAATPIFATAWWYFAFPGAALLLTVLAFNLARRRRPGRPRPAHGMTHVPPEGGSMKSIHDTLSPEASAGGCVRSRGGSHWLRGSPRRARGGRRDGAKQRAEEGGTITVLSAGDVDHIDPGQAYYSFTYEITYADAAAAARIPAAQRQRRPGPRRRACRRSRRTARR